MIYALTDQKRLAIDDYISRTKLSENREKFLQRAMTQQIMMTLENLDSGKVMKADGSISDFNVEKALAMNLIKRTPRYEGEKSVFVVGKGTYDGLVNGCKIENYMRAKEKIGEQVSLEEFFNNFINFQAVTCLRANRQARLEAEFKQVDSETPNKDKPKN